MTMSVITLVVSCLLLGVATADTTQSECCWPKQFEGKLSLTSSQKIPNQGTTLSMSVGTLHIDYTIAKTATMMESSVNGKTTVISDLKKEDMYIINTEQKTCMKLPLPDYMKGLGRPCFTMAPTSTETLGGGDEALVVNMYEFKMDTGFYTKVYNTQKQCWPVTQDMQYTYLGTEMLISETYSNVQLGIKDPSVFDLPDYCNKQEGGDMEVKDTVEAL